MTDGAAVVSLQPLAGVSTDRFFDATRLIRLNLDYIANETVGYLTSTQYRNPPFTIGINSVRNCAMTLRIYSKQFVLILQEVEILNALEQVNHTIQVKEHCNILLELKQKQLIHYVFC
jgi:hypothetical protein